MKADYTTNSHYLTYTLPLKGWEYVLFEHGSEKVKSTTNWKESFEANPRALGTTSVEPSGRIIRFHGDSNKPANLRQDVIVT